MKIKRYHNNRIKRYNQYSNTINNIDRKTNDNINSEKSGKNKTEEVFVFPPTTYASSEKKENDKNKYNKHEKKDFSLSDLNIGDFLDKVLNEDFLIPALIIILIFERMNLKKSGADKNLLSDYDLMIGMLIYIYF